MPHSPAPRRVLGLDLGGTNIKTTVLEVADSDVTSARHLDGTTVATYATRGPGGVIDRLVEVAQEAIAATPAAAPPIAAVGLGIPGLFDHGSGVAQLLPNLPGDWDGQPIRGPIAAALGLPVTLINDARAFALAEGTLGAARGCPTVVCLTLGTGIGGGVLIDGEVRLGAFGTAGELGHQTADPDGARCGCGNRGCVEALAQASVLCAQAGRGSVEEVVAAADAGDERALAAIARAADAIGIAIANAYHVLGPDRVVLGGGIATAGDTILEPIREAVRRRATLVPRRGIDIVPAELGARAGAIGAGIAAAQALVRAR
jgi:glucokinase